jgi:UDP-N-acetylmuramoyl-tripeptide--D-alanyl-D-alanine ligase
MIPLSLDEIRVAVGGRWVRRGRDLAVHAVTTDSRAAAPGQLFIALRGAKFDGHQFLAAAAGAGCPAAIVAADAAVPEATAATFAGGAIAVADTTRALGALGACCRARMTAKVIGVTGSNGKTTVKRMIHHILSRRLKGTASPKSFNNDIGVPLTLLGVGDGYDYVVCELGSNNPGEIGALAAMSRPDVAVITSVGPSHLERFGTIEGVAAEKTAILAALPAEGVGVVLADSDVLAGAAGKCGKPLVWFGTAPRAQWRLTDYQPLGPRQRFQVNGRLWAEMSMPGRHNAVNALAALAVAERFGVQADEAAAALADFAGEAMRLEWRELSGGTLINDAYNANPASLAAAGEVLAGSGNGRRKVIIVGDMLELGAEGPALHRQCGRTLAERGVNLVVAVGELGRYIADGAAEAGCRTAVFATVDAAAAALPALLAGGDVVLLKASRGAALERLLEPVRAALGEEKR